jgi:YhcH/YjgK/YiaL family protein
MKTNPFLYLLIIFTMAISCTPTQNPENWDEKELSEWFSNPAWKADWKISPDESVNQKEMAKRYFRNPERWEKAFAFLRDENLSVIKPGRYELEGPDLFVNVDEYETKNEEVAHFEAHRKYADIQYLVSGEEKIGVIPLKNTTATVSYDSEKDIVFLDANENNYRLATSEKFFVFFPEDAHRPGVKTAENTKVRKIVVKVRID